MINYPKVVAWSRVYSGKWEGCGSFSVNSPFINGVKPSTYEGSGSATLHEPAPVDPRSELVERIAASNVFHKSARVRDFLLYIAERTLSHRLEEISEAHIGTHVFGRPPGYNASEDSIVRVTARQLRLKLAEYFEHEGRQEPLIIEIPKGSYVPVFCDRPVVELETLSPQTLPLGAAPVSMLRLGPVLAAFCAVLAGVCAWLWFSRQPGQIEPPLTLARWLVNDSLDRTLVIAADTGLIMLEKLTGMPVTVEAYANRDYLDLSRSASTSPGAASLVDHLRSTTHTGIADLATYGRIVQQNPDLAGRIQLRHARQISALDLKPVNVILLGEPRGNPWASLFIEKLNFQPSYDYTRSVVTVVNRAPAAAEQPVYEASSGLGYALVVMAPNVMGSGRVLIAAGTSIEAKEAAGDFITDPASFRRVLDLLRISNPGQPQSFELLLRVRTVGKTSRGIDIVTHRMKQ